MVVLGGEAFSDERVIPVHCSGGGGAREASLLTPLPALRDWYFIAEQPAPAPHLAFSEGSAALRIVLVTVPRVSPEQELSLDVLRDRNPWWRACTGVPRS